MKDMMKHEMEIVYKMLDMLQDENDAEEQTKMMELQKKVNDLEKYEKYVKDLEKYACQSTLLRARW